VSAVVESVRRTTRLVVVEENAADYGISAAVVSAIAQEVPQGFASRRIGAAPVPLPGARHLADAVERHTVHAGQHLQRVFERDQPVRHRPGACMCSCRYAALVAAAAVFTA